MKVLLVSIISFLSSLETICRDAVKKFNISTLGSLISRENVSPVR